MKIIILTGKFGMGHMTAALAVKQQIEDSQFTADVEVIDWLDYVLPRLADKYYTFFHFFVDKGHRIYNIRYRFLENRRINQKPEFHALFRRFLTKLIDDKEPDLVISTLPVCSQLISAYKEETGSVIPLITYVTDITGHSEWINKNTDFYFVGSRSVAEKFILKGVESGRIFESGLPVRLEFIKDTSCHIERQISDIRHVLIMGGGLGMLPKDHEFYKGLEQIPNTEFTVITGKNHELYECLEGKYNHIKVLGYVNNVHDFMRQADAIITKPGGVTTFEAIYAEAPILAFHPSLQQEIYNAQYIQEMGIGTVLPCNSRQCLEEIEHILGSSQLNCYRSNIKELKSSLDHAKLIQILEMEADAAASVKNSGKASYYPVKEGYNVDEAISFNL